MEKVNNFLTLVNSIMYVASLKGYRWLGVSLGDEKLVNELKKKRLDRKSPSNAHEYNLYGEIPP